MASRRDGRKRLSVRVFKSKRFAKFARKERISDASLCKAVKNADAGLIDADYGGGVIKQRIARPNEGKSGGYRSIILFRRGVRSFFVFGFAKSEQANIDASTGDGHISLGMPVTVEGTFSNSQIHGRMNGGGPALTIHTGDGSIRLSKS